MKKQLWTLSWKQYYPSENTYELFNPEEPTSLINDDEEDFELTEAMSVISAIKSKL